MGRTITLSVLGALLGLVACGPSQAPVNTTTSAPPELALLLEASQVRKAPYDKLAPVPVTTMCLGSEAEVTDCQIEQLGMLKDWPDAWTGNYQAQRNVAHMLSNATSGVNGDQTQGCAWRIVLTLSGHSEYNGALDEPNYNLECGGLNAVNWAAAKEAAKSIYQTISGKALPPVPEPARQP
jgi:hypothetical protein